MKGLVESVATGRRKIDSSLSKDDLLEIIIGCRMSDKARAWNLLKEDLTIEEIFSIFTKTRHSTFLFYVLSELMKRELSPEQFLLILKNERLSAKSVKEVKWALKRKFPDAYADLLNREQAKEEHSGSVEQQGREERQPPMKEKVEAVCVRHVRRRDPNFVSPWEKGDLGSRFNY